MTQIEVLVDGVPTAGTLLGRDMANDPQTGEHTERLTVQWADQSKTYVWPHREQVREVPQAQPPPEVPGLAPGALAHLQPPPGQQPLPPPMPVDTMPSSAPTGGLSPGDPGYRPPARPAMVIGQQPVIPPPQSFQPQGLMAAAPMIPITSVPQPPKRQRFMVQAKGNGRPRTYHTHTDCARVTNGAPQLPVDDAQIEFFDLTQCTSCKKQDEQLTWQELVSDFLADQGLEEPLAAAYRLQGVLQERGFRVTPPAVDRPDPPA